MTRKRDLQPIHAGVIYSPGGAGWMFYPEERLFVGVTGARDCPTYVRSMLMFPTPGPELGEALIEAVLCLRLVEYGTEAPAVILCLREPPDGEWSIGTELDQPVLTEIRLGPADRKVRLDLTATAAAWSRGEPNKGVVLDFAEPFPGVVAFAAGRAIKPPPFLRLIHDPPARPGKDAREGRG